MSLRDEKLSAQSEIWDSACRGLRREIVVKISSKSLLCQEMMDEFGTFWSHERRIIFR